MSPASYLTAPPRVAAESIARYHRPVPLWVWICLGISLAAVVLTLGFLTVRGVTLWRRIVRLEETAGVSLETLLVEVDTMNARLERANESAEDIRERLDKLNVAMEKVAVIRWALSDTREAVGFWKALSGR